MLTAPAPGVLGNDADPDGDPLTAVLVTGPSHGSLTVERQRLVLLHPGRELHRGEREFSYRASDGTLTSNLATVTLSVSAVNDAPTVAVAAGGSCGTDDRSGTINLTVGDLESAAAALTLERGLFQPQPLLPAGNIAFAGSGATRTVTASDRGRAHRHRGRDHHRQRRASNQHGPRSQCGPAATALTP